MRRIFDGISRSRRHHLTPCSRIGPFGPRSARGVFVEVESGGHTCDVNTITLSENPEWLKNNFRGADMVLFPECWITGYAFPDIVETKLLSHEIENHPDFKAWYDAAIDENSP